MKTSCKRSGSRGYVSYVMVISTGVILTMLMMFGFRRAMQSQSVQSDVQLRLDYSEKEDAVLRSLVAIVPNRARSPGTTVKKTCANGLLGPASNPRNTVARK